MIGTEKFTRHLDSVKFFLVFRLKKPFFCAIIPGNIQIKPNERRRHSR